MGNPILTVQFLDMIRQATTLSRLAEVNRLYAESYFAGLISQDEYQQLIGAYIERKELIESGIAIPPGTVEFIDADDILSGKAFTDANPKYAYGGYEGIESGELQFVANGPPFIEFAIREAIKRTLEQNGLEYITITSLETMDTQFLGLPLYGNYRMKVVYHGSPALAIAPVMVYIFAALAIVGVVIVVYQVTQLLREQEQTKRRVIDKELIDAMPTDTPEERQAKSEAIAKSLEKYLNEDTGKGFFGDLGPLIGWGIVGLIVINALPAIKDAMPKRSS